MRSPAEPLEILRPPGPLEAVDAGDQAALRRVLGHFLTGVAVVTGRAGGLRVGMTVNSFTSVSLDPPLVLFCAARSSATARQVIRSGAFAVNLLAVDQQDLADRFASPVADRFDGVDAGTGRTGSPILAGGLGFLDCRLHDRVECGDHVLVVGEVVEAGLSGRRDPLAFFRGRYRSLLPGL